MTSQSGREKNTASYLNIDWIPGTIQITVKDSTHAKQMISIINVESIKAHRKLISDGVHKVNWTWLMLRKYNKIT